MVAAMVAAELAAATPAASGEAPLTPGPTEPILPLHPAASGDPALLALGRRLFHDPALSRDGTVSCASCHPLASGGSDNLVVSVGVGGAPGSVNSPTVYNTTYNIAQFWDGRATTLERQIDGPLTNPVEMATTWPMVVAHLNQQGYAAQFQAVFHQPPSPALVRRALAAFEASLVTSGSRFDHWLDGDREALSSEERQGYALFKSYGCASCHQGVNVGGNLFQRLGFFGDYFADRGHQTQADLGRFNVTGRDADRHVFKVPSLRLAVMTPPYFHDGSVANLADAIRVMGHYQLGRDIPDADIALIARFLASLAPSPLAGAP